MSLLIWSLLRVPQHSLGLPSPQSPSLSSHCLSPASSLTSLIWPPCSSHQAPGCPSNTPGTLPPRGFVCTVRNSELCLDCPDLTPSSPSVLCSVNTSHWVPGQHKVAIVQLQSPDIRCDQRSLNAPSSLSIHSLMVLNIYHNVHANTCPKW